jgi:hypothetical protein
MHHHILKTQICKHNIVISAPIMIHITIMKLKLLRKKEQSNYEKKFEDYI